jgi:acyl dehydratase
MDGPPAVDSEGEEITFPEPVRIGDRLRVETEVLDKRESKSRPETGIVRCS